MKRIVLWFMSTVTVLVLLFGYHTSTSSRSASGASNSAIAPITGGSSPSGPTTSTLVPGGSTTTGSSQTGSSGAATTVTGSVAQTEWGPVQVQITVADGRITDVAVVQYPSENGKDQQINARALPVLINETISAQSASIDMVSGATITSRGYLRSLQNALDQAGL